MATSLASITYIDYSSEKSTVKVNSALLTSGNIVAQEAAFATLISAIGAITLGNPTHEKLTALDTSLANAAPSNPLAQRENKWLVRSLDNVTGKILRNEIPCSDLSNLVSGTDFVTNFTAGVMLAFKTAWEAFVLSEDGNAVTVQSLEFVGKRL